jgi:hypothetical protein
LIISNIVWRQAVVVLRELLFLPIVWLLIEAPDSPLKTLATMFFLYFATFVGVSCDVPVKRAFLTDIRSPEFFVAGTRLILACALLGAGSQMAFVCICGILCMWTLGWGRNGCSVLWVQVLRFGVGTAAILGSFLGFTGLFISSSIPVVALLVGCVSRHRRQLIMREEGLPGTMQKLKNVQGRLGLWGDKFELPLGSSVQEVAFHLLLLEDRIPIERLTKKFMVDRPSWRRALRAATEYNQIKDSLEQLSCGIATPWPSTALTQLLTQVPVGQVSYFPRDLAALVVSFADECQNLKWSNLKIEMPQVSECFKDNQVNLLVLFNMAQTESTKLAKNMGKQPAGERTPSQITVQMDSKEFLREGDDILVGPGLYPKALP